MLLACAAGWAWWLFSLPASERNDALAFGQAVLALVGLLVARLGWLRARRTAGLSSSTAEQVDAAAERLAEQLFVTWSREVVQRGIETPAPVRVRWTWGGEQVGVSREELAASPALGTDPAPLPGTAAPAGAAPGPGAGPGPGPGAGWGEVLGSGAVTRLHDEVYARLRHGRLVLIGGPGAGKTGAMVLLLLEALRHRRDVEGPERSRVPVPVWLTLGSWDPEGQGLREWVVATAARDHPYLRAVDFGPDVIGQLFDTRRLVLFLDGLDEMPDVQRVRAVHRLRLEAGGLRVVLSSRPEEYRETLRSEQLPLTAVVELTPVRPRAAGEYLLAGQAGPARAGWQQVADHLQAFPGSVAARTLTTPLTLSLARHTYAAGDPAELLSARFTTEQELRGHLLDQVLVIAYPDGRERARARYWLGWIARHMNTGPGGATRDLAWWQIPGWLPRRRRILAGGVLGGVMIDALIALWVAFLLLIGGVGIAGGDSELVRLWIGSALGDGVLIGLVGGVLIGLSGRRERAPTSLAIHRPTLQDVRARLGAGLRGGVVRGVLGALLVALVLGLTLGVEIGADGEGDPGFWIVVVSVLEAGLVIGLVAGVVIGAATVWIAPGTSAPDALPRSTYRRDVQVRLVGGLLGLLGGLLIGWVIGPEFAFMIGPVVWASGGASPQLLIAQAVLALRGRPVRFMPLLETALERQVLRQAGAVYQFRHADLQDRLAALP